MQICLHCGDNTQYDNARCTKCGGRLSGDGFGEKFQLLENNVSKGARALIALESVDEKLTDLREWVASEVEKGLKAFSGLISANYVMVGDEVAAQIGGETRWVTVKQRTVIDDEITFHLDPGETVEDGGSWMLVRRSYEQIRVRGVTQILSDAVVGRAVKQLGIEGDMLQSMGVQPDAREKADDGDIPF